MLEPPTVLSRAWTLTIFKSHSSDDGQTIYGRNKQVSFPATIFDKWLAFWCTRKGRCDLRRLFLYFGGRLTQRPRHLKYAVCWPNRSIFESAVVCKLRNHLSATSIILQLLSSSVPCFILSRRNERAEHHRGGGGSNIINSSHSYIM